MRALVISDAHFGAWTGEDLLRHDHELGLLTRHLDDVDKADLAIKERALARTKPLDSKPGRYRPPDAILGFLHGL